MHGYLSLLLGILRDALARLLHRCIIVQKFKDIVKDQKVFEDGPEHLARRKSNMLLVLVLFGYLVRIC